jgi:hypothetical protein
MRLLLNPEDGNGNLLINVGILSAKLQGFCPGRE